MEVGAETTAKECGHGRGSIFPGLGNFSCQCFHILSELTWIGSPVGKVDPNRPWEWCGKGSCSRDLGNVVTSAGVGAVMAEKLQDLGKTFKQPFFQTYWIHSSYGIMYIVWSIWL